MTATMSEGRVCAHTLSDIAIQLAVGPFGVARLKDFGCCDRWRRIAILTTVVSCVEWTAMLVMQGWSVANAFG